MDAPRRPGLPLGVATPPHDGAELARRIRASLSAGFDGVAVAELVDEAVVAAVSGFDIPELSIDLTGARVERRDPGAPRVEGALSVGRGEVGRLHVHGSPLLVLGAPATVEIDAGPLPIHWVRRSDDVLELRDDLEAGRAAVRGRARVDVAGADVPLLLAALVREAEGADVELADARLELSDAGADAVALAGSAHARFGALSAPVDVSATVRVVEGRALRVEGFEVRSRKMLAAMALGALRSRIAEKVERDVDLVGLLPASFAGARLGIASRGGGFEIIAELGG